jgi:hypothetical protein
MGDVTVMDAFEGGMLDLPDFYFTGDDYRYHFEPEAKQRFLEEDFEEVRRLSRFMNLDFPEI